MLIAGMRGMPAFDGLTFKIASERRFDLKKYRLEDRFLC